MKYVKGEILTINGFQNGYISIDKNKVIELSKGHPPKKSIAKGIIVPTFINAHTHIGDAFVKSRNLNLPKNIEELVCPPNGLKHLLLKKASDEEIILDMRNTIQEMIKSGISYFCDFRESGMKGINQIKTALKNKKIGNVILSRPSELKYDKEEIDLILKNSDGIGLSSISDWDYSEIQKVAFHTKKRKKKFVLHASEAVREDIDKILDLKPDFLIHMIKATESDLICVKQENIPIVICPRSNDFFNLKLDLNLFKKTGVDLIIGTDNAMINSPNVLEEINFLRYKKSVFSIEELLNMITYTPRKVLNLDYHIQGLKFASNFVILDKKSLRPIYIFNNAEG